MKKFLGAFLGIMICFISFNVFSSQASAYTYPNGKASQPGDILVTSKAFSKGIAGHSAVVVDSTYYLETKGDGYYPKLYKISDWFGNEDKKNHTDVVRINNATKAKEAAEFAKTYDGSKIPYKIKGNLLDNQYTYCSKLVYQVYALGTSGVFPIIEGDSYVWTPYDFLLSGMYKDVTPSKVYSKGMLGRGDF